MSKKLRHHYVPSGLTRNFCIEEKRVYYYDVKEKTIKPSSPGDAFRIKKLHSIVKEGGEVDHNSVEDWLMQFEGNGCATIKKLLAGNEISQDERETCPPNGSWDICKTIKFPENDKTNGNKVCKSLGLGKCRGVNREQVTGQGAKDFLKYDCSEELHFSATDNQRYCWTIPFQVQGWPTEKCLDQKTEVICCK